MNAARIAESTARCDKCGESCLVNELKPIHYQDVHVRLCVPCIARLYLQFKRRFKNATIGEIVRGKKARAVEYAKIQRKGVE